MQLDLLQDGVAVLEHAGRKPCLHTVEDPNVWLLDRYFGIGFMPGKNEYRSSGAARQLLDHHPDRLLPGLTVDEETLAAIGPITSWLLAAWWRIDEVEHR